MTKEANTEEAKTISSGKIPDPGRRPEPLTSEESQAEKFGREHRVREEADVEDDPVAPKRGRSHSKPK